MDATAVACWSVPPIIDASRARCLGLLSLSGLFGFLCHAAAAKRHRDVTSLQRAINSGSAASFDLG